MFVSLHLVFTLTTDLNIYKIDVRQPWYCKYLFIIYYYTKKLTNLVF